MFTGIISHLGKFEKQESGVFTFSSPISFCSNLKKGDSVSVNGVCLTVTDCKKNLFRVDLMPETLKRTILGLLRVGDAVNLEKPLRANGRIDGHFVQGHVDGKAEILSIEKKGNSRIFSLSVSKSLSKYLARKGSVAVNGISLTIIESKRTVFTVGIIPFTWNNTMLSKAKIGDLVNIEVDILAKYLEKLTGNYNLK